MKAPQRALFTWCSNMPPLLYVARLVSTSVFLRFTQPRPFVLPSLGRWGVGVEGGGFRDYGIAAHSETSFCRITFALGGMRRGRASCYSFKQFCTQCAIDSLL